MADTYYAFTINAANTNAAAYYSVNFFSQLTVVQGAYQFTPTATSASMVSIYPNSVGNQLPPCRLIGGGITLLTSANQVSGQVGVSPAQSVPVTFQLWGLSLIGTVTVSPGQTEVPFAFNVSGSDGLSAEAAQKVVAENAPKS